MQKATTPKHGIMEVFDPTLTPKAELQVCALPACGKNRGQCAVKATAWQEREQSKHAADQKSHAKQSTKPLTNETKHTKPN